MNNNSLKQSIQNLYNLIMDLEVSNRELNELVDKLLDLKLLLNQHIKDEEQ